MNATLSSQTDSSSTSSKEAESSTDQNELYLIDGSGFIFRAYYAMAYRGGTPMTNADGTPVGAVYVFTNMLLKLLDEYHAPYMAVIFDAARENFRNEIYPEYKANRDETPEDLIPQFPLIRDATEAFDIPCIELEGYEADDLIAAYTRQAREQGKKVVIVSSDKDLMQLVGDGVRMLDPMKGQYVDHDGVIEKFGVTPDKVVDVQALAGDSTDNVPGVPGIGIKTAASLINEYGTLENLLENLESIKQNKRRETLIENQENARISKKLVKLDDQAPVPVALENLKTHDPDKPDLFAFLEKQGFKSILSRLSRNGGMGSAAAQNDNGSTSETITYIEDVRARWPSPKKNEYTLITEEETLKTWLDEARENGLLVIDTETTGLTPMKADLVGISLTSSIGKAAYIPLAHKQEVDLLGDPTGKIKQLPIETALSLLKPLLEDPSVIKIAHNMKYDWQMFAAQGIEMSPCDDTMLISYVLDGGAHSHGMDNLSKMYFDFEPIKYEEVAGKGKSQVTFDFVSIESALDYAAEDAEITLRLYEYLKPRLAREKMVNVYENIERPLIPVIAEMEMHGIKIDPMRLHDMSAEFGKKLVTLEKEIYVLAGQEFNVASPKQVGEILFGSMGLKGAKKTKTGDWSTSVSVLEKLAQEGHEIVAKILEHRQLSKLKSTYTDALQAQINHKTGRVHTSFSIAHTATGRLSSSDPNLQNIPIRTEDGRRIRTAFVAENDNVLLSVDYSQIELRLAAEMAGIEALQLAFKNGQDIHALTASQVFDVPLEEVTPELRRSAKAVNFGIIYGISSYGLAKQLGVGREEAGDFIRRYLARFPELQDYMSACKAKAKEAGYVETLYGRKCMIQGINDKNGAVRGFAERQAINAPLQGTAADIMKIAMAKIPPALAAKGLSAKMLLQVHDELVFEVPEVEREETSKCVVEVMESAYRTAGVSISVPLNAEAGFGLSWADAH